MPVTMAAHVGKVGDFIVDLAVDVGIARRYHDRGDTGRADSFPSVIGEAMGVTVGVDIRNYRA